LNINYAKGGKTSVHYDTDSNAILSSRHITQFRDPGVSNSITFHRDGVMYHKTYRSGETLVVDMALLSGMDEQCIKHSHTSPFATTSTIPNRLQSLSLVSSGSAAPANCFNVQPELLSSTFSTPTPASTFQFSNITLRPELAVGSILKGWYGKRHQQLKLLPQDAQDAIRLENFAVAALRYSGESDMPRPTKREARHQVRQLTPETVKILVHSWQTNNLALGI